MRCTFIDIADLGFGEESPEGDSVGVATDGKYQVVFPANVLHCQSCRASVCNSTAKEGDDPEGVAVASKVGGPDFRDVDVGRAVDSASVHKDEEKVKGNGGIGTSSVIGAEVVLLQYGLNHKHRATEKAAPNYSR